MNGLEIVLVLVCGFLAGGFAGAMGVGGGVIIVPVLTELIGLDQTVAQGTSLAAIIITASVATVSAHKRGLLDAKLAGKVAAGGFFGAIAGALLATQVLDALILRRIFGVVVLATAARIGLKVIKGEPDAT